MTDLSGPRAEAASGETRSLVIFLHGYGADGNDLIGLAQPLAGVLPDTAFLSPNAPEPCSAAPMGRQWFPIPYIDGSSEEEMIAGFRGAEEKLQAFLDAAIAEAGVAADRVALIGFSQGAMMGLHVGLRRSAPLAAIIGFSGRLITDDAAGPITSRSPVLLVHGDADEVVPPSSLEEARAALEAEGVPVRWSMRPGLGHGIDQEGLTMAAHTLREALYSE